MYDEELQEENISVFQILLFILGKIFFLLGFAFLGYLVKEFFAIIGPGLWLIIKTIFFGTLILFLPSLAIVSLWRANDTRKERRERKAAAEGENSAEEDEGNDDDGEQEPEEEEEQLR